MRKKGIITEYLPWILIGIAVLVVLIIAAFYLREGGIGLIDKLRGIFTGRG